MSPGVPLILDLLTYIEQLETVKTKPAYTVPTQPFAAYQHELKGLALPGIHFDSRNLRLSALLTSSQKQAALRRWRGRRSLARWRGTRICMGWGLEVVSFFVRQ